MYNVYSGQLGSFHLVHSFIMLYLSLLLFRVICSQQRLETFYFHFWYFNVICESVQKRVLFTLNSNCSKTETFKRVASAAACNSYFGMVKVISFIGVSLDFDNTKLTEYWFAFSSRHLRYATARYNFWEASQ